MSAKIALAVGAALVVGTSVALVWACSTNPAGSRACDGVACSGHGSCQVDPAGAPYCACDRGWQANGLECRQSCQGVQCAANAHCELVNQQTRCVCDAGFQADGQECVGVGAFVFGLNPATCAEAYSECQLSLACVIDPTVYLEGAFPGRLDFFVATVAGERVLVKLLFLTRPTSAIGTIAFGFCEERDDLRHTWAPYVRVMDTTLAQPGGERTLTFDQHPHLLGAGTQFWVESTEVTARFLLKIERVLP